MPYFPPAHPASWEHADPAAAGVDAAAMASAASFAAERETPWGRDLARIVETDFGEKPPWNEALGPVRPRGGPNGLVLRGGRIVAEWGDIHQIDQTFSVAKSYLSILAGLAWDRRLRKEFFFAPGRAPLGPPPDPRPRRAGAAHGRRWRLRPAAQPPHYLAPPAAADLGMGRRAVGQARFDRPHPQPRRPPRGGAERHASRSARAGRLLGIQRCAGQPAGAGALAAMGPPLAGSIPGAGHGPDRRLAGLGVARLPQFLCRARRQPGAIGVRRLALGRRRLHPRPRPSPHRPFNAAPGPVGRKAHPVGSLVRPDARALSAVPAIRPVMVAQYRPGPLPQRFGRELLRYRRRRQPDLDRPRQRHRRGDALD